MGQPCPIVSSCHGTVGVTGACLPAGYSVAVGEFDGNPKTKGKAGGGGGDRNGSWAPLGSRVPSPLKGSGLCQPRSPVRLCAPMPTPVLWWGHSGLSSPAEYVVGVPNKSNTRGEVSGAQLRGDVWWWGHRCGRAPWGGTPGWGQGRGLTLLWAGGDLQCGGDPAPAAGHRQ